MAIHMQLCEHCKIIRVEGEKCICGHVAGQPVLIERVYTASGGVSTKTHKVKSAAAIERAANVMVVHGD